MEHEDNSPRSQGEGVEGFGIDEPDTLIGRWYTLAQCCARILRGLHTVFYTEQSAQKSIDAKQRLEVRGRVYLWRPRPRP